MAAMGQPTSLISTQFMEAVKCTDQMAEPISRVMLHPMAMSGSAYKLAHMESECGWKGKLEAFHVMVDVTRHGYSVEYVDTGSQATAHAA